MAAQEPIQFELARLAGDLTILSGADRDQAAAMLAQALVETRSLMFAATDDTDPRPLADYRQWARTVDEVVRRCDFGPAVELDSAEILRRCERGVGRAIRNGQASGTIASRENPGNRPRRDYIRKGKLIQIGEVPPSSVIASPRAFLPGKQIAFEIYALIDGIGDDWFDQVIAEARAEGNLSRANVIRRLGRQQENFSRAPRRRKAERIAELAADGVSSRQMAEALGISDETIRNIAREFDVEIPADKIIARTRRPDSNRIVTQTVDTLSSLVLGLDLVDYDDIDLTEVGQWVTSMDESFRALNRFKNQLKKVTHQQ